MPGDRVGDILAVMVLTLIGLALGTPVAYFVYWLWLKLVGGGMWS